MTFYPQTDYQKEAINGIMVMFLGSSVKLYQTDGLELLSLAEFIYHIR
jgi:hypothetical protein